VDLRDFVISSGVGGAAPGERWSKAIRRLSKGDARQGRLSKVAFGLIICITVTLEVHVILEILELL